MLKFKLFDSSNPAVAVAAPFGVFFGTDAPSDLDGNNGDYYFRYHNGTEALYKKSSGTWQAISGAALFSGYDYIAPGQTVTIPQYQQSVIQDGIDIEGTLNIEGKLIIL